jgi:hypothetical protein
MQSAKKHDRVEANSHTGNPIRSSSEGESIAADRWDIKFVTLLLNIISQDLIFNAWPIEV